MPLRSTILPPLILILLVSGPAAAQRPPGHPTDDPTMRPYQEKTATYIDRCAKSESHVDTLSCLGDQIKTLQIRVKSEFKKQLAEAEATAAEGDVGGTTGAERAKIERANLIRSQAAWEAYNKADCESRSQSVELGGGNGGGDAYAACAIRHLVGRYNELRDY